MINIGEVLLNLWNSSGFAALSAGFGTGGWQNLVMLIIACVLLYLAIVANQMGKPLNELRFISIKEVKD